MTIQHKLIFADTLHEAAFCSPPASVAVRLNVREAPLGLTFGVVKVG